MPLTPYYSEEDDEISSEDELLELDYEESIYPSKTYKLNTEKGRIVGFTDGVDAIKQAIYCILSTERYQYEAYDSNYGVELNDLIGQPMDYVVAEIQRRITEALTYDSRIETVEDFEFLIEKQKLTVSFVVYTIYGENVESDWTVII